MESHHAIAVIGGGISGLAAARRIRDICPSAQVTVVEATPRVGGVLSTRSQDGWLFEQSADSFLTKQPWATDFCRSLPFETLIPTNLEHRRAQVVRGGRVYNVPARFVLMSPGSLRSILASPVLSWRGKFRLALESLVPARSTTDNGPLADESIASFARRRLGREAFERLVQPLLAGIYAGDPETLSMAATMPQFLEQEREFGSLTRAARRAALTRRSQRGETTSGASYEAFLAPQYGMQSLVDAIVASLPPGSIRLNTQVVDLQPESATRWRITTSDQERWQVDGVIVTTPARIAGQLLAKSSAELATHLSRIDATSTAVICLGYREAQFPQPPSSFGIVVPTVERRELLAVSFSSVKFPGRAPAGHVLARAFLGGFGREGVLQQSDDRLRDIAHRELKSLLQITGEPVCSTCARWPRAMPQYRVGHLELIEQIEALVAQQPGLEIAGNSYRGVGIPQCIRSGTTAADRLVASLTVGH